MNGVNAMVRCALLICLALAVNGVEAAANIDPVTPQLSPEQIEVGLFYHGADVQVTADIPACDGAVLILKAEEEEITLNRKGRVAGIWLNVGQVTISGIPSVYVLAGSKQLDDLCSEDVQLQLGLGFRSLRQRMKIVSERSLIGTEAEEFLNFKLQNHTYDTALGITLTRIDENRQRLAARLPISASVPPGSYRVTLYCFADGQTIQQGTTMLNLERVGLVRLLADLAHTQAALYGVMAILIAMVVGIVIGVIFQSLPGSGH